jgi:hypothetical protein
MNSVLEIAPRVSGSIVRIINAALPWLIAKQCQAATWTDRGGHCPHGARCVCTQAANFFEQGPDLGADRLWKGSATATRAIDIDRHIRQPR